MAPLQAAVDRLLRLRVEVTATCWRLWRGGKTQDGYGMAYVLGEYKTVHQLFYAHYKGEIPEGYRVVCTCSNRLCVNPDHLKAKQRRDAILDGTSPPAINAAKTHCIRDHALTGANLYVAPSGSRGCRTCLRLAAAKYRNKRSKYLA